MKVWACLLAGLTLATIVSAEEDIASRLINKDTNGTWNIQPDKPKAKHIKADVEGGYAFRVKSEKRANPWDVQASSPVAGAINEGDVIMLHYFARAEEPAEGGSALTARIQLAGEPYTSLLEMTSKISGEWQSYCSFRIATMSVPEKQSSVSIHLATAKQVIDLGPVLVFNFGKGYDTKKLGFCDG